MLLLILPLSGMHFSYQDLAKYIYKIFYRLGANQQNAKILSTTLTNAEFAEHPSHGFRRIKTYIQQIQAKEIHLNPKIKLTRKDNIDYIDGRWGLGQIVMFNYLSSVDKSNFDIKLALLKNLGHIGRLYDYAEYLAKKKIISLACAGGMGRSARVCAYGGIRPVLFTNPIYIGIPTKSSFGYILDMSTSAVAEGKVRDAYEKGKLLDDAYLIDYLGNASKDPKILYEGPELKRGSIKPFGGYKGFGLSFMVETLAGALTGGKTTRHLQYQGPRGNSLFLLMINLKSKNLKAAHFYSEIQELVNHLKSDSGVEPEKIVLPGERTTLNKLKHLKTGVDIPDFELKIVEQLIKQFVI